MTSYSCARLQQTRPHLGWEKRSSCAVARPLGGPDCWAEAVKACAGSAAGQKREPGTEPRAALASMAQEMGRLRRKAGGRGGPPEERGLLKVVGRIFSRREWPGDCRGQERGFIHSFWQRGACNWDELHEEHRSKTGGVGDGLRLGLGVRSWNTWGRLGDSVV